MARTGTARWRPNRPSDESLKSSATMDTKGTAPMKPSSPSRESLQQLNKNFSALRCSIFLFLIIFFLCSQSVMFLLIDRRSILYPRDDVNTFSQNDATNHSPMESARYIRQCMENHGLLWRHDPGKVTDWAGRFVYEPSNNASIIVGPIVPKVASSTFRLMTGNIDRPKGLKWRDDPKPNNAFQVAAVRNPIEHFLSTYRQVGVPSGLAPTSPVMYCKASEQQKLIWFRAYLKKFLGAPIPKRNEHSIPQLHWFQDYMDNDKSKQVPVIDRVDAVIRLEHWDKDWSAATKGAMAYNTNAYDWMTKQAKATKIDRLPLPEHLVKGEGWYPLCGENGAKPFYNEVNLTYPRQWKYGRGKFKNISTIVVDGKGNELENPVLIEGAMQALRYHYARKFIHYHMQELCQYLSLDFKCFRYPLPDVCAGGVGI